MHDKLAGVLFMGTLDINPQTNFPQNDDDYDVFADNWQRMISREFLGFVLSRFSRSLHF